MGMAMGVATYASEVPWRRLGDESHAPALHMRVSQKSRDRHRWAPVGGDHWGEVGPPLGQPRPQPESVAEAPDLILGTQSIGSWGWCTILRVARLSSLVYKCVRI